MLCLGMLLGSFVLYSRLRNNKIVKYIVVLQTLVHEFGHALTAVLLGSKVKKIELFENTEGLTISVSKNKLASFFITISGYFFSSFFASACLFLYLKQETQLIAYALTAILLFSFLFWIRNGYGFLWSISWIAVIIVAPWHAFSSFFIAVAVIVLVLESMRSAWVIFYLTIKDRKSAGDATSLQKQTGIPAIAWGFIFFLQGILLISASLMENFTLR